MAFEFFQRWIRVFADKAAHSVFSRTKCKWIPFSKDLHFIILGCFRKCITSFDGRVQCLKWTRSCCFSARCLLCPDRCCNGGWMQLGAVAPLLYYMNWKSHITQNWLYRCFLTVTCVSSLTVNDRVRNGDENALHKNTYCIAAHLFIYTASCEVRITCCGLSPKNTTESCLSLSV